MLIIKEIDKLDTKTKEEWKKLWQQNATRNYFNSLWWFQNYISVYQSHQYTILKGYNNNSIQFILPLIKMPFKNLVVIGGRYLDKVSFLYKGDIREIIKTLEKYCIESKKTITLLECNFNINCIKEQKCITEFASDNPFVSLNQDLDSVIKRKEKRYIENILRKNNNLSFKIISGKDVQDYIDIIFDIESRSNKIKKSKALFVDEKVRELFRNISKTDYSMLCILYYNNIPIAHMIGLIATPSNFMAYHMAFDKEYSHFQPGKLVIYHLLNYLKNKEYNVFDFSRGNSLLKKHFSIENSKNYNVYINPNVFVKIKLSFRGLVKQAKQLIKKFLCIIIKCNNGGNHAKCNNNDR